MSLRQIRDSYFHSTYFSFPLLFFIYYYLINGLIFVFDFFFFKTLFCFSVIRSVIRSGPIRSDPDFVDAEKLNIQGTPTSIEATSPIKRSPPISRG